MTYREWAADRQKSLGKMCYEDRIFGKIVWRAAQKAERAKVRKRRDFLDRIYRSFSKNVFRILVIFVK